MNSDSEDNSPAVAAIENMVLEFLKQLLPNDDEDELRRPRLTIKLVDRSRSTADIPAMKELAFPRRKTTQDSSLGFAQLLRVCQILHQSLIEDVPVTKRDIYYRDVTLFKSQRTVDTLVDDLAATFELERSDFNVRATAKGLVCGSGFSIELKTGDTLTLTDVEATLIPVAEDVETFHLSEDVSWVLIVEKDAIFYTLCKLQLTDHPSLPGRGIMITGKGYPDVATRQLVKTLSDCLSPSIPILALVDCDAFGVDILSVYKYGSQAMKHENAKLAAPRVKWLGLLSSELKSFGVDLESRTPITRNDEKKAIAMLRRPPELLPKKWKKEISHMLFTRRKAEIEILCSSIEGNSLIDFSSSDSESQSPIADSSPESNPPLVNYLTAKITSSVARAQSRIDS